MAVCRKIFLLLIMVVCWVSGMYALEPHTVMVLKSSDLAMFNEAIKGCQELFLSKGQNVNLVSRILLQSPAEQKKLLAELKVINPSVVLTLGTSATDFAAGAIPEKPLVCSMLFNPSGTKTDFKKKNITGIFLDIPLKMQLSLIKKILPQAKNIGLLYDEKNSQEVIDAIQNLQNEFGVTTIIKRVSRDTDVPKAISEISKKIDLLWLLPDTTVCTMDSLKYLLQYAVNNKLAVMGFADYLVKAGALFSFQYDYQEIGKQTGEIVWRVTQGESPENIPIAYPQKLGYIVNLKVAAFIDVTIPESVIKAAQTVIQND